MAFGRVCQPDSGTGCYLVIAVREDQATAIMTHAYRTWIGVPPANTRPQAFALSGTHANVLSSHHLTQFPRMHSCIPRVADRYIYIPGKAASRIVIWPGRQTLCNWNVTVLNAVLPKFDPEDEWMD